MELLDRLSQAMAPHEARVLKMFGGTAFKVNENLAIGPTREGVIVRVGPEAMADALARPGARAMAFNRSLRAPRAAAKAGKARRKSQGGCPERECPGAGSQAGWYSSQAMTRL